MLTPLEKCFKEYSMYVLMVLGRRGRGTKSRAITICLSPTCGGYNRALRNEKLLSPLLPCCIKAHFIHILTSHVALVTPINAFCSVIVPPHIQASHVSIRIEMDAYTQTTLNEF